ncbi:MAG: hypothetical protein EA358_06340 [Flavobacteriales bacterium]|nr:MAG: hypothetical protein EA358_06340 [Flavobacteriales bacterium]
MIVTFDRSLLDSFHTKLQHFWNAFQKKRDFLGMNTEFINFIGNYHKDTHNMGRRSCHELHQSSRIKIRVHS